MRFLISSRGFRARETQWRCPFYCSTRGSPWVWGMAPPWFQTQNSIFCFQDVEGQKVALGGFQACKTQWRWPFYCTTRVSVGVGYGAPMVPDPKFDFLFSSRRRLKSCTRGFLGMGNSMAVSVLLYDSWLRGCGIWRPHGSRPKIRLFIFKT